MSEGWKIEVRTAAEMERGLVRDDIKDPAYPPHDERRYTDRGKMKMGLGETVGEARD